MNPETKAIIQDNLRSLYEQRTMLTMQLNEYSAWIKTQTAQLNSINEQINALEEDMK